VVGWERVFTAFCELESLFLQDLFCPFHKSLSKPFPDHFCSLWTAVLSPLQPVQNALLQRQWKGSCFLMWVTREDM
jgi:hypothetical protein